MLFFTLLPLIAFADEGSPSTQSTQTEATAPADTARYTVVYWVEKPAKGADFVPTPGKMTDYDFAAAELCEGAPGQTVRIDTIPGPGKLATSDPLRYAEFQASDPTVISDTGDTVVSVYCTLKTYTLIFDLGDAANTLTLGGQTYGVDKPYPLAIKYGQQVTDTWPSNATATFAPADYAGWTSAQANEMTTTQFSRVITISSNLAPKDPTVSSYTINRASGTGGSMHLLYYVEQLPGQTGGVTREFNGTTYVLMPEYSQDDMPVVSAKQIYGLSNAGIGYTKAADDVAESASVAGNDWEHLYYDRTRSTIHYDLRGHGEAVAAVSDVPFGASLARYDEKVAAVAGFEFKGWTHDPYGLQPFDFSAETMPTGDLILFAKWEPEDLTIPPGPSPEPGDPGDPDPGTGPEPGDPGDPDPTPDPEPGLPPAAPPAAGDNQTGGTSTGTPTGTGSGAYPRDEASDEPTAAAQQESVLIPDTVIPLGVSEDISNFIKENVPLVALLRSDSWGAGNGVLALASLGITVALFASSQVRSLRKAREGRSGLGKGDALASYSAAGFVGTGDSGAGFGAYASTSSSQGSGKHATYTTAGLDQQTTAPAVPHSTGSLWQTLPLVFGIISPILFFLTQDTAESMVAFDEWSFVLLGALAVQIFSLCALKRSTRLAHQQ
jgi:uncharacterized repeat protein (TIGR02543 family)